LLIAAGLGTCEAVIGLQDHTFDDAGDARSAPQGVASEAESRDAGAANARQKLESCKQFCARANETCRAAPAEDLAADYQVYETASDCQAACELLSEPQIACRDEQLGEAARDLDYQTHCQAASLGGSTACDGNCENYCALMNLVCTGSNRDPSELSDCVSKCRVLRDRERDVVPGAASRYGATRDREGDTLQCRLVHLTLAATPGRRDEQCWQAALAPRSGPGSARNPCSARAANCDDYCQIAVHGCSGEQQIYESLQQCAAVCARLAPGEVGDLQGNTIGCRSSHAYNGLVIDAYHCTHAGPGGAGACGDDCESYCQLFQAGCDPQFRALYGGAAEPSRACQTACVSLAGERPIAYSTTLAGDSRGPSLACRLLYTARALEQPDQSAQFCESAAGEADCRR
jgi:hypothetical protein